MTIPVPARQSSPADPAPIRTPSPSSLASSDATQVASISGFPPLPPPPSAQAPTGRVSPLPRLLPGSKSSSLSPHKFRPRRDSVEAGHARKPSRLPFGLSSKRDKDKDKDKEPDEYPREPSPLRTMSESSSSVPDSFAAPHLQASGATGPFGAASAMGIPQVVLDGPSGYPVPPAGAFSSSSSASIAVAPGVPGGPSPGSPARRPISPGLPISRPRFFPPQRPASAGTRSPTPVHTPSLVGVPELPNGVQLQGFLAKSSQTSYAPDKSSSKEKKAWKPYKVQLRDGNLCMYKLPSSVADEVRALFPLPGASTNAPGAPGALPIPIFSSSTSSSSSRPLPPPATREDFTSSHLSRSLPDARKALAMPPNSRNQSPAGPNSPQATRARSGSHTSLSSQPVQLSGGSQRWHQPGKHADLDLSQSRDSPPTWAGRVEKGTLTALAHEFVFATQLPVVSPDEEEAQVAEFARALWVAALSRGPDSVLQLLGSLAGHLSVLTSEPGEAWSAPRNAASRSGTRVQVLLTLLTPELVPQQFQASVLQAFHDVGVHAAHATGTDAPVVTINALVAELQSRSASRAPTPMTTSPGGKERPDLAPLLQGQFPPELVITLDPTELAEQIQAWHVELAGKFLVPYADVGALLTSRTGRRFLSWSLTRVHPLTKACLDQLLSPAPTSAGESDARVRAKVLRHWIAVTTYLQTYGDHIGWAAVAAAICSRPVARLDAAWRFISPGDQNRVTRGWAPALERLGFTELALDRPLLPALGPPEVQVRAYARLPSGTAIAPIPFFGDALLLLSPQAGEDPKLPLCPRQADRIASLAARPTAPYTPVAPLRPEYRALFTSWAQAPDAPVSDGVLEHFLQRSFEVEPTPWSGPVTRLEAPPHVHANATLPLLPTAPAPLLSLADSTEPVPRTEGTPSLVSGLGLHLNGGLEGTISIPRATINTLTSLPLGSGWGDLFGPGDTLRRNVGDVVVDPQLVLRPIGVDDEDPSSGATTPTNPVRSRSSKAARRVSQDIETGVKRHSRSSSLRQPTRSAIAHEVTVHVEIKAASFDRLVDVMVLGVSHIPAVVTNQESRLPPTSPAKLRIDTLGLQQTLVDTYRSLCTGEELFRLLILRFQHAHHAVEMANPPFFPLWTAAPAATQPLATGNLLPTPASVQLSVLGVLRLWVERCAQDFYDSPALWKAVSDFLRAPGDLSGEVASAHAALVHAFALATLVHSRDTDLPSVPPPATHTQGGSDKLDIDTTSPSEVVSFLESVVCIYLHKITRRDWTVASSLLERQSQSSSLAWFPAQVLGEGKKDDWHDLSMYGVLDSVTVAAAPASTASDGSAASPSSPAPSPCPSPAPAVAPAKATHLLLRALPAALTFGCAVQHMLRGWTAAQVTAPQIGIERRKKRMLLLLDALYISRARLARQRSVGTPISAESVMTTPCVSSFVAGALAAGLTSHESRIFAPAWQAVAQQRQTDFDTLWGLGPTPAEATLLWMQDTGPDAPASAIDIGWVLGCMAQAFTQPYDVPSGLVAWDQHRLVHGLVEGSLLLAPSAESSTVDPELSGARLRMIQGVLGASVWNRRLFKEDAYNEAGNMPLPQTRVFASFLAEEHAARKRIRAAARDLQSYMAQSQHARAVRPPPASTTAPPPPPAALALSPVGPEEPPVRPMLPSPAPEQTSRSTTPHSPLYNLFHPSQSSSSLLPSSSAPAAAPERRARRVTALFRSSAGLRGGNSLTGLDREGARSADELLMVVQTSSKPAHKIKIGRATVSAAATADRAHVFHLTSADGGRHVFQATGSAELSSWVRAIDHAAAMFESAPSMLGGRRSPSLAVCPIFGVDLLTLSDRVGAVPAPIETLFSVIESRHLTEVGLYRVSGAKSTINALKKALDTQPLSSIDLLTGEFSDPHTLSGVIKQWYRDMPEPVVPFAFYHHLITAEQLDDPGQLHAVLRGIIRSFPPAHYILLRRTIQHLTRVAAESKANSMPAHNLGLVFGTSLLNPPGADPVALGMQNIGRAAHVVKILIEQFDVLFDAESEAEDEPDADVGESDRLSVSGGTSSGLWTDDGDGEEGSAPQPMPIAHHSEAESFPSLSSSPAPGSSVSSSSLRSSLDDDGAYAPAPPALSGQEDGPGSAPGLAPTATHTHTHTAEEEESYPGQDRPLSTATVTDKSVRPHRLSSAATPTLEAADPLLRRL